MVVRLVLPVKRYPCEETTLDLYHGHFHVRLWVTNDGAATNAENTRAEAVVALNIAIRAGPATQVEVCERIAASGLFGLAAVQVINVHNRIGHMIYTEPFNT